MAEQDSSKALIPPSATTDTFSRRRVITTAATGAALMALGAPAVHAQTKTIRFLNAEPGRESVRALRVAAAEYEKQTGVKVVVDTVPPNSEIDGTAIGTRHSWPACQRLILRSRRAASRPACPSGWSGPRSGASRPGSG